MPFDQNKPTTLADALARLAKGETTDTRHRDRISAISRIATMLGRNPADVPCDAPNLRQRLSGIHPLQHGMTGKSLANVKSALADALRATGCLPVDDPIADRTAAWDALLACASASHQAWGLSRLASYCCHRGTEPDAVNDGIMAEFQGHLDVRLLTKDPARLCKEMAQTWNGIVSRSGLPLALLTYEKGGQYRCRPLAIYPDTLQQEIGAYIGRLSHVDIFDEEGPDKPLRPASLRNTEAHIRQYLDGLVCAGDDPQDLTTLAAVITPDKMKLAFRAIMGRRGTNSKPVGLQNIAATVTAVARHHLKLDDKDLASIQNIKKRVSEDPNGMSQKNRERLGQFKDWENVVHLVTLPDVLMDKANTAGPSRTGALLAMHAAAIAILLCCPVRAKNLAGLDLDRHVISHRSGTHSTYSIRIEGAEVKNGEPIEVELNSSHSKLLRRYITQYRPLVSRAQGTALFPKESDGKPRSPGNLGQTLMAVIQRETGLTVNAHLFRHFAAFLYLRERPGEFETARRLLKHRRLQTTMDFYAELSNQWAHDHYDQVVLSKFGGRRG